MPAIEPKRRIIKRGRPGDCTTNNCAVFPVRSECLGLAHQRHALFYGRYKRLRTRTGFCDCAFPATDLQPPGRRNAPLTRESFSDANPFGHGTCATELTLREGSLGRSINLLRRFLYLGQASSHFWLCVFAQAAIFLYLCHTFIVKCLRLPFPMFAAVISFILVATPVSFFISFMMPDVFASFLILSAIMIVAFWSELERVDKICISAILIFAVLTHASHLLLLFLVGSLCALICLIVRRKPGKTAAAPVAVLFAIFFVGLLGEAVFSYATKFTVGV